MTWAYMAHFVVLLMLLFGFVVEARDGADLPTEASKGLFDRTKVDLSITSEVPGIVTVHCQSKEDDIGVQTLEQSKSFSFSFTTTIWFDTLFWCSFNVGSNHKSFDVYHRDHGNQNCRHDEGKHVICDYAVRNDGLYLKGDSGWILETTWS